MDTKCSKCGQEDASAYNSRTGQLQYFCDNCGDGKRRIGAPAKTELRKQLDAFSEFDRVLKSHNERLRVLEAENKEVKDE